MTSRLDRTAGLLWRDGGPGFDYSVFGVPVFGLLDAPALEGLRPGADPETAFEQLAEVVLGLPLAD